MRRVVAAALVWGAVLSMGANVQADACASTIYADGPSLVFEGCISTESAERAIELISTLQFSNFLIQSEGGSVNDALHLAENIARTRMTVTVRRYCYSSCANYIIAAGKQALLEEGSIIILHGDAETTRPTALRTDFGKEALAAIDSIVRREQLYRSRNPKAQLIHDLQLVARGPKDQPIQIAQGDRDTVCHGMGLGAWSPSGTLLLQLSLIDGILPASGVSFTDEGRGVPPDVPILTRSPLRDCSPAPSPSDFD